MNDTLKMVAKFGIDLGEKAAVALADGKVNTMEIFGFLPVLMQVPDIISKKESIVAEWKALDSAGRVDLNNYIQTEFTIENKDLEAKIEKGITAVLAILDLVTAFQKPAEAPAPIV